MNPVASPPAVTAPPRKRRWLRRLLVILLIFVGLPAGYYFYATWSLERELADAIAETDALDPRWRLEDIQADRKTYLDDDNSALLVAQWNRLIGRSPAGHRDYDRVFNDLRAPVQLNTQQTALLREVFERYPKALDEARKLKDMKGGRFPITYTEDWINTPMSAVDTRVLFVVLAHDAMLRAHDGDLDGALESCMALASATRSFGDEPSLLALWGRLIGDDALLVWAIERCLAQGHPCDSALDQLQAAVASERAGLQNHWLNVMRGERAGVYRLFLALRQGTIRVTALTNTKDGPTWWERTQEKFPTLYTRDFPRQLRHMNQLVATGQLPFDQQLERLAELENSIVRKGTIRDWTPSFGRWCKNLLRAQATLAATQAGLACERFRIANKRWPDSLTKLVEANLLDSVPTDPFDGQPLRLARRKDGLTVYSVGPDKEDNGGNINRERPDHPGADIGFRLWDPEHRRQPPRPPVALEP
jgi:hypothetical protein